MAHKRFLAFKYDRYDPCGATGDMIGDFNCPREALERTNEVYKSYEPECQIYDRLRGTLIYSTSPDEVDLLSEYKDADFSELDQISYMDQVDKLLKKNMDLKLENKVLMELIKTISELNDRAVKDIKKGSELMGSAFNAISKIRE